MGIPVWTARRPVPGEKTTHVSSPETQSNPMQSEIIDSPVVGNDPWAELQNEVTNCTACDLHATRTQTVFGVGNHQADLMVVGEAPGRDEDLQGEPFVGKAGQLLNQMLLTIGFQRQDIFIANILKCRPPNNRDPLPEEVAACSSFLARQINLVKPKVILSVGGVSAKNLLHSDDRIGKLRGIVHTHQETGTPLIATYHPAYLLRSPTEKRKVWSDLLLAKKLVSQ